MRFTIAMILGLSMMATAEGTCADSTTFFVGDNTNRGCSWVADKASRRCVEIDADPDHEIPIYCPITCDTCPTDSPTTGPTTSPTDAPIGSPSESPTLNPTNSPTLNPTDSPTNSPTDSPTPSPTVSPTFNPTSTPTTATPTDSPTVSPTPFPSTSPTFYPTLCLDSTTFYFGDNTKRNCEWASNPRYSHVRCNKPNDEEGEIRAACPVTCGGCPEKPTSAPVASPTDSSTSSPTMSFSPTSSCVDSSTFYLHTNTRRTCEWASRNIDRCSKPVDDNNEVQANCPVSCGTCP